MKSKLKGKKKISFALSTFFYLLNWSKALISLAELHRLIVFGTIWKNMEISVADLSA